MLPVFPVVTLSSYGGGPFVPAFKTCLLVYRSEERKITIGFSRIDWPPAALTIRLPPS